MQRLVEVEEENSILVGLQCAVALELTFLAMSHCVIISVYKAAASGP